MKNLRRPITSIARLSGFIIISFMMGTVAGNTAPAASQENNKVLCQDNKTKIITQRDDKCRGLERRVLSTSIFKGDKGAVGDQGVEGEKGDKGATGSTGAQGAKGDTGQKGLKGDSGGKGLTGKSGVVDPRYCTMFYGPFSYDYNDAIPTTTGSQDCSGVVGDGDFFLSSWSYGGASLRTADFITSGGQVTGLTLQVEGGTLSAKPDSFKVSCCPSAKRVPLTKVTQISGSPIRVCVTQSSGGVKCWGWSGNVENIITVPTQVSGLSSGVSQVGAGDDFGCALMQTGEVKCWGANGQGQLGNGTTTDSPTPTLVQGIAPNKVKQIAVGVNACALLESGGVKCWGFNGSNGLLGIGSGAEFSPTAVDVVGLSTGVKQIVTGVGSTYSCAILNSGEVKCWGRLSSQYPSFIPNSVAGLGSGVVQIGIGRDHACAVLETGGVKCWGINVDGQLGDGTNIDSDVPVLVPGLSEVKQVSAGYYHSCALMKAGEVKCWGSNFRGQLGNGAAEFGLNGSPVSVTDLSSGVVQIVSNYRSNCALLSSGKVKCWGQNEVGELGIGTSGYIRRVSDPTLFDSAEPYRASPITVIEPSA